MRSDGNSTHVDGMERPNKVIKGNSFSLGERQGRNYQISEAVSSPTEAEHQQSSDDQLFLKCEKCENSLNSN